jgi:hypothetical protein
MSERVIEPSERAIWSHVDEDGDVVWLERGVGPDDRDLILSIDGDIAPGETLQAVWLSPEARAELAALLLEDR